MPKAFNKSSPFGKLNADKLTVLNQFYVQKTKKNEVFCLKKLEQSKSKNV